MWFSEIRSGVGQNKIKEQETRQFKKSESRAPDNIRNFNAGSNLTIAQIDAVSKYIHAFFLNFYRALVTVPMGHRKLPSEVHKRTSNFGMFPIMVIITHNVLPK